MEHAIHKITNTGRNSIDIVLRPGTVTIKLGPGEHFVGEICELRLSNQTATFKCEPIEE